MKTEPLCSKIRTDKDSIIKLGLYRDMNEIFHLDEFRGYENIYQ